MDDDAASREEGVPVAVYEHALHDRLGQVAGPGACAAHLPRGTPLCPGPPRRQWRCKGLGAGGEAWMALSCCHNINGRPVCARRYARGWGYSDEGDSLHYLSAYHLLTLC
uniref:Uncharacterized protein n=1 Tax=Ursus maritimus TaxID=29073 RepID=A0A452TXL7_URSMA